MTHNEDSDELFGSGDSLSAETVPTPGEETPPLAEINDFDPLFRQGTILLHKGKVAEAIPYLERAHELNHEDIDATINLAGAYILSKKFRKAVAILEPLSEQHPDHPMVWTNLGAAYLGNPVLARDVDQERAIAAFERALDADPEAPSVAYNIGLIYRDRGETEKAITWFRKALEHNPGDVHAMNILRKMEQGPGT